LKGQSWRHFGHAATHTTQLYDRRHDDISLDEVERRAFRLCQPTRAFVDSVFVTQKEVLI
jgi:hypothetical protein